ncbi:MULTISPECIES: hypothetical protein [unclassified Mesorhizobium]|uniref:hypothetical protein n=1 Tax=unclassified Mesorhizobium TaxID=325217 RepID=UPI000FCC6673|nr:MULTISPECIES: hypothetical protein [unclassified Mesorhizobium]RUX95935.1 hypothetical protein EN993_09620 [Mesorhizobium sp. M7D.F.Ca.US.004.01.2.1]RVA32779.1 hypothetical protein EN935_10955 [Mesorhizobium sp. M7D.F.Ca.US.004.03.1.1]
MRKPTPKPERKKVEMLDGRVYFSDDNWQTVWQFRGHSNGRSHRMVLDKQEADQVRLLVAYGAAD